MFDIILKRQRISNDISQLNVFTTLFANCFDDIFLTSSFFLVPGKHTTVKMVNFQLTFIAPWRNIDEYITCYTKISLHKVCVRHNLGCMTLDKCMTPCSWPFQLHIYPHLSTYASISCDDSTIIYFVRQNSFHFFYLHDEKLL